MYSPKGPYAILSVIATPPTTNDTMIKRHDKKKKKNKIDIKTNTDSTTFTDSGYAEMLSPQKECVTKIIKVKVSFNANSPRPSKQQAK